MNPRLNNVIILALCTAFLSLSACKSTTSPTDNSGTTLTGTLVYDNGSGENKVATYSFSSQSETVILTNGSCPSWTPTGEVIYEEPSNNLPFNNWKIATISATGMNKHILLDSKMYSINVFKSPKVSQDGSTICFSYWLRGTSQDIYRGHGTVLMKSDGTLLGGIDSLFDGSWMPNGSLVLSATVDGSGGETTFFADGLYLLSADMKQITEIGTGLVKPKHPAASPDGKQVAFSMGNHIWMINADGTGLRQVTTGSKLEGHPCWSPDGKYIACSSYGTFEIAYYAAIAAIPANNTSLIDLTNDSPYWVRDPSQSSGKSYGRVNPRSTIAWR